jgi:hypothetical protein
VTVVYIVLSHRNPEQVLRLVRALREGPAARVLVRHDPRAEPIGPKELEEAGGEPVEDGIPFEWAGWPHVQVLLGCLREAVARHDPDWALILSGQDYPLRPLADIEAELDASLLDGRLGSVREVERRRPAPGDDEFFLRANYRHYTRPRAMPDLPHALRPLIYARELPPLVGIRRIAPAPVPLAFSSDWLTLGRRAIQTVLAAADNGRLMRYFRRVAVPSESLFASVLLSNESLTIERDHRRVADFAHEGAAHPDVLTRADFDRLVTSGADFARKFDAAVDSHVLDLLDEHRRASRGR